MWDDAPRASAALAQAILVPPVCTEVDSMKRRSRDAETMFRWVHALASWRVITHNTFVWEASLTSAQRAYERFMRRVLPEVSYFYAIERNPGRDGYHIHALWADCEGVFRKKIWEAWFTRYGRNRVEPVLSKADVADYCSKYVTKEGAWWNVRLVAPELFHRNERSPAGTCAKSIVSAQRPVAV